MLRGHRRQSSHAVDQSGVDHSRVSGSRGPRRGTESGGRESGGSRRGHSTRGILTQSLVQLLDHVLGIDSGQRRMGEPVHHGRPVFVPLGVMVHSGAFGTGAILVLIQHHGKWVSSGSDLTSPILPHTLQDLRRGHGGFG